MFYISNLTSCLTTQDLLTDLWSTYRLDLGKPSV